MSKEINSTESVQISFKVSKQPNSGLWTTTFFFHIFIINQAFIEENNERIHKSTIKKKEEKEEERKKTHKRKPQPKQKGSNQVAEAQNEMLKLARDQISLRVISRSPKIRSKIAHTPACHKKIPSLKG